MQTMAWIDPTRIWFLDCSSFFAEPASRFFAARRGMRMKVRALPGSTPSDDAVGRATEMGRSCCTFLASRT